MSVAVWGPLAWIKSLINQLCFLVKNEASKMNLNDRAQEQLVGGAGVMEMQCLTMTSQQNSLYRNGRKVNPGREKSKKDKLTLNGCKQ